MIRLDEDALICDFAETYHIYDYNVLPALRAGVLAAGLRQDSRIKMVMSKRKVPIETVLLAGIVDRLSVIIGGDTARLIAKDFIDSDPEESYGFETGADFDAAWAS